jgi:hypothetical protein
MDLARAVMHERMGSFSFDATDGIDRLALSAAVLTGNLRCLKALMPGAQVYQERHAAYPCPLVAHPPPLR